MSANLLQVENLTLISSQGYIVKDLSFHVDAGEIVALTGKSGSGKTSVALALLQLLPQGIKMKSGLIRWKHEDKREFSLPGDDSIWPSFRGSHIGFTQQDVFGAFDPVLKMGRQMTMIIQERAVARIPRLEVDLRRKMEEVGLQDLDRLWDSYPHQLSGGQLQRCQIAMAVVIQPELLITDEPTSAIDKINQLELLEVFAMLRDKYNMAILCITHEEAVVRLLADREIRLEKETGQSPVVEPQVHDKIAVTPEVLLEVRELMFAHTFGGMVVSKGATIGPLNFTLSRGICLGIIGESGSGKSTLAQLLVGLYLPTKGLIMLDGKSINFYSARDIQSLRSKVQLVMQDGRGSLHPHMTVRDLLQEIMDLRPPELMTQEIDLVMQLLEVGLPESVLDRRAAQLSGGECLRVSIARTLLVESEILICDESTSALDANTRYEVVQLLRSLMFRRGLALVFISHDEHIIREMADEILVMDHGKVVEKGPAAVIIRSPVHPVTRKIFTRHATLSKKSGSLGL